jgi:hypothetical protein
MYDTYQVMVGESMFYGHQVYRQQVNGAEAITQEFIAHLKKKRRKHKAKIQELSDVIHEQNFLLQHNDQYMLELENQLEVVPAPPPKPAIPELEEEEDPDVIQGESEV